MADRTLAEYERELGKVRESPTDGGVLKMIVRRPDIDAREVMASADLDLEKGLVGDNWSTRGSSRTPDGSSHPEMQLTLMNSRLMALLEDDKDRWQLAGDQLFVDIDLSIENLPPGSLLSVGSAMVAISEQPHTGCKKFAARYGVEALKFVNSPIGKELRLRGANARVVQSGEVRVGDAVTKVAAEQKR